MSVPDELQIGAMQKEAAISRSRERIFTNIVYWLCSGIKNFARFVDQPNRFSFTIKTVQVKLNRRMMLWKIFKCFVEKCHRQLHEINYRIIDGKLFVLGKIFEVMRVQSVEVLPQSRGAPDKFEKRES